MAAQTSAGTTLITSATGAVGRAVAARLAPGWAIVLQVSEEFTAEAEELAQSLRAAGGSAAVVVADLAEVAAAATIVERAAAHGPVTLLVNAATRFEADPGGFDAASFDRLLAVNLRAPWQLAARFAAALPAQASGAIVNIVDRRLWQSEPAARSYELSQAALCAATRTMARTYAPRIRVNAAGPPQTVASAIPAGRDRQGMPLAGATAPDAIASAVLYLATAAAVTGQMIAIDPG